MAVRHPVSGRETAATGIPSFGLQPKKFNGRPVAPAPPIVRGYRCWVVPTLHNYFDFAFFLVVDLLPGSAVVFLTSWMSREAAST
jgi:hypothetical protein